MTRPGRVRARAFAKLNLHLEILGRRPDGFHELRSLFQSVDLHDSLDLRVTDGPVTLRVRPAGAVPARDNLVLQALGLLRDAFPGKEGAQVTLLKRIPVGAGLGGGSSDAAAALLAGSRLWGLKPSPQRLRALAARLGADVPFFLKGGAAWMGGRGDRVLRRGQLPGQCWVVASPGFGISSGEAYGRLKYPLTGGWTDPRIKNYNFAVGTVGKVLMAGWNDFEAPLRRGHPRLDRLYRAFTRAGARGRMTGSGSALYAPCEDDTRASSLHHRLESQGFNCWIVRPTQRGVLLAVDDREFPERSSGP